jgi:hypothetical protein
MTNILDLDEKNFGNRIQKPQEMSSIVLKSELKLAKGFYIILL